MGATVVSAAGWLIVALIVKLLYQAIIYRRGKKSVQASYLQVQTGTRGAGSQSKLKVLVTGGSGFLGRTIVELLTERFSDKFEVVVFDAVAKPNPSQPTVTYIQGDLRIPSHVVQAMKGVMGVIHSGAMLEQATTDLEEMYAINVGGTQNVIEAALQEDTKAMVYTSSVSVFVTKKLVDLVGVREDAIVPDTEDMLLTYAANKSKAETYVLAANGHVLQTVVLRPGGIYGPGDRHLVDLVTGPRAAYIGHDNPKKTTLVWVRDVARAHVMALVRLLLPQDLHAAAEAAQPWCFPRAARDRLHPLQAAVRLEEDPDFVRVFNTPLVLTGKVAGKVFHLTHDLDLPLYRIMSGGANPPHKMNIWGMTPRSYIPIWLAMALGSFNEYITKVFGFAPLNPALTRASAQFVLRDAIFSITAAQQVLGWQPTPFLTVVRVILAELEAAKASKAVKAAKASIGSKKER